MRQGDKWKYFIRWLSNPSNFVKHSSLSPCILWQCQKRPRRLFYIWTSGDCTLAEPRSTDNSVGMETNIKALKLYMKKIYINLFDTAAVSFIGGHHLALIPHLRMCWGLDLLDSWIFAQTFPQVTRPMSAVSEDGEITRHTFDTVTQWNLWISKQRS